MAPKKNKWVQRSEKTRIRAKQVLLGKVSDADYRLLTRDEILRRSIAIQNKGYPISKWLFCAWACIESGLDVVLYQAKETVSKYLYLADPKQPDIPPFKLRFSDHSPSAGQVDMRDCDFYIGVVSSRSQAQTTEDAMQVIGRYFGLDMVRLESEDDEIDLIEPYC